jgi:hypothetical protein
MAHERGPELIAPTIKRVILMTKFNARLQEHVFRILSTAAKKDNYIKATHA